jgi:hypothetical protein
LHNTGVISAQINLYNKGAIIHNTLTCSVCATTFKNGCNPVTNIPNFPQVSYVSISSGYGSKYDSTKRSMLIICDDCLSKDINLAQLLLKDTFEQD